MFLTTTTTHHKTRAQIPNLRGERLFTAQIKEISEVSNVVKGLSMPMSSIECVFRRKVKNEVYELYHSSGEKKESAGRSH